MIALTHDIALRLLLRRSKQKQVSGVLAFGVASLSGGAGE